MVRKRMVLIRKFKASTGNQALAPSDAVPAEIARASRARSSKHFRKVKKIHAFLRVALKSNKLNINDHAVYRRMVKIVLRDERRANDKKLAAQILTRDHEIDRLQIQIAGERASTNIACESARAQHDSDRDGYEILMAGKDAKIQRLQAQNALDRAKADRAQGDSRARLVSYREQHKALLTGKDQDILRLGQQLADAGLNAIRISDAAGIRLEYFALHHDSLMIGKDQEIERLKAQITDAREAAEQFDETTATQYLEIAMLQLKVRELEAALANSHVLREGDSTQYMTTISSRDTEIARLCATQTQFITELADQNIKIASLNSELQRSKDINQGRDATICTLESSLVNKDEVIARSEKSLEKEMRITEDLYTKNIKLGDRLSFINYNKRNIAHLEDLLASKAKELAFSMDCLVLERSKLESIKILRDADSAQHAKELSDRNASLMRLCATQNQLVDELAGQNIKIASLTTELTKAKSVIQGAKSNSMAAGGIMINEVDAGCSSTENSTTGACLADNEGTSVSVRDNEGDTAMFDPPPEPQAEHAHESTVPLDSGFLDTKVSITLEPQSPYVHPASEFPSLLSDACRLSCDSLASGTTLCDIESKASSSTCSPSESKLVLKISEIDNSQPEVFQGGDITVDIIPVPLHKPPGRKKAISRLKDLHGTVKSWRP
ncbi:hypothetical protein BJ138DRAFT_1116317 [Hygrophoropsis aurantiaca]|uniref:Uncharacterized protein n=1 Tax=Hygrophoropsis aurantiaca TaxID=72124 RepID=A0ACB8A3V9_9AGAM|nr:hypothetical protein BJ138DRAFT_1116317 [Hygrophoropsis aurantiaca]